MFPPISELFHSGFYFEDSHSFIAAIFSKWNVIFGRILINIFFENGKSGLKILFFCAGIPDNPTKPLPRDRLIKKFPNRHLDDVLLLKILNVPAFEYL